jgi:hypothetical protein
MKKLLFLSLIMLSLAFASFSQTIPPPYINYQAVLYDVNGANPNSPLTNQSFSTFVNINDELGNLLYREEHYASTDANGLITVKIGDGLYTAGPITNFNQINWGVGKYYLVVDFNINGTISSTAPEQLVTVPYSFYAGKAGNGMTAVADNGNGTLTFTYANGQTYITPALSGITGPVGPAGAQGIQGLPGANGATGQNGLNALIKTTSEAAGANCTNGGTKIETGLDANGNGVLDGGEVNVSETQYVCNGLNWTAGGGSITSGTNQGEMLYWNGSSWVNVPPGQMGQYLTFCYNYPQWGPCLAQITTAPVSNITGYNAISGGQITSDGGTTISARGVCWDINPSPDLNDNFTSDGIGIGNFASSLTNLSPITIYYFRAFATNSGGTVYGNEISFTSGANLPSVVTGTSSNISYNSASVSGNVTSDGGAAVTQRGICYSTSANPTISNSIVVSGSGMGTFSTNLTGLLGNTVYYARAFATNSSGTAYGDQVGLTTFQAPAAQSCSGWPGPNTTSSLMNQSGFITAHVGQNIDISMVTTHPFITCCQGPNQNCGASSIFNPVNSNIISYNCAGQTISETITIPIVGIYQITVICGNTGNRTCNLSIEIIP